VPRANTTDPDVQVMHNHKGYAAGYNGQIAVTADQVIIGARLSQHPDDRILLNLCVPRIPSMALTSRFARPALGP
jgi:hypothetical protein